MRKVFVTVPVSLVLLIDDGVEVAEVMDDIEITAETSRTDVDIDDITKGDHQVMDSK